MNMSLFIDIHSPPATVFDWVEKNEKAMKWMTSVAGSEILHETSDRIGTKFREVVKEDGKGVEIQGEITGYEQGRSISFHLISSVNVVDVEFRVEAIPIGTRLTQKASIRWRFPINVISIFMGAKMKRTISTQSQKEFEKLKKLCENSADQ